MKPKQLKKEGFTSYSNLSALSETGLSTKQALTIVDISITETYRTAGNDIEKTAHHWSCTASDSL